MNERIKEIAEQAGIETVAVLSLESQDYVINDRNLTSAKIEQFAKLVATECMALCTEQQEVYTTGQFGTDDFAEKALYATGSSACVRVGRKIAAHFGVERCKLKC